MATVATRFGTEVEVLGATLEGGTVWLKVRRPDGSEREWAAHEFKGDVTGAIKEVAPDVWDAYVDCCFDD